MMQIVVCRAPGELNLEQRAMPTRKPDEVLLRVRRVGVCGTDMHIFRGKQPFVEYPLVMGHELAAEVVEAPAGSALTPGDIACVMPYLACGRCVACRRGKPNCCVAIAVLGVHRDGGLAEFLCVPESAVLKADGVSLDDAAMVEFLAIGAHAVRRASIIPGQRVLVAGAGPIGLGVSLFARLAGGHVTALDRRPDRLAFCQDVLGVPQVASPSDRLTQDLSDLSDGDFFDVVFDATGHREAMEEGFRYVAHGGAYVLVSIVPGDISFTDAEFHKRETTLLASRNATLDDFAFVLAAMREGRVPSAAFATHHAKLADLPEALPHWMAPSTGVIKALVEI